MGIALVVMLVVILGAVYGLSKVDLGRATGSTRPRSDASSASTLPATTPTAVPVSAPKARKAFEYTVKDGDILGVLAKRFDVSTGAIVAANQLTNPDRLVVGQVLTIPRSYPVTLTVSPAPVAPGGTVELRLAGAEPGDKVRFEIAKATGSFTGPVHVVSGDGIVTTSYVTDAEEPAGTYPVIAHRDGGASARAELVIAA